MRALCIFMETKNKNQSIERCQAKKKNRRRRRTATLEHECCLHFGIQSVVVVVVVVALFAISILVGCAACLFFHRFECSFTQLLF